MNVVVSDTTPLNYLVLVGIVDVLPKVFANIFVPTAVIAELAHPRAPELVRAWTRSLPSWLRVQDPKVVDPALSLGPGENAAIALAEEVGAHYLLIDERDGRRLATERGLKVAGLLAVMSMAAELDVLDLPSAIERLRRTNFHAREALLEEALRLEAARRARRSQTKPQAGEPKRDGGAPQA